MCGILGFTRVTDRTREAAAVLGAAMEKRGGDSWGYCALTSENELVVRKGIGGITSEWFKTARPDDEWKSVIYHTRAASHGTISLDNAHPFTFKTVGGGTLVGTHNGIVTNHDELCKTYKRDFQVDSMHIFANLAEGLSSKEINGWGSLAWMLKTKDEKVLLCLCRFNHTALWIAEMGNGFGIVYGSEEEPVKLAAMIACGNDVKARVIAPEQIHFIDLLKEPDVLYKAWKTVYGMRGSWVRDTPSNRTFGYGGFKRYDGILDDDYEYTYPSSNHDVITLPPVPEYKDDDRLCAKCNQLTTRSSKQPLCKFCMTTFIEYYTRVQESTNDGRTTTATTN